MTDALFDFALVLILVLAFLAGVFGLIKLFFPEALEIDDGEA